MQEEEPVSIHQASRHGKLSVLRELLADNPALSNEKDDQFGWTPLYRAVLSGQLEAARLLLQSAAEPNLSSSVSPPTKPLRLASAPSTQPSTTGTTS